MNMPRKKRTKSASERVKSAKRTAMTEILAIPHPLLMMETPAIPHPPMTEILATPPPPLKIAKSLAEEATADAVAAETPILPATMVTLTIPPPIRLPAPRNAKRKRKATRNTAAINISTATRGIPVAVEDTAMIPLLILKRPQPLRLILLPPMIDAAATTLDTIARVDIDNTEIANTAATILLHQARRRNLQSNMESIRERNTTDPTIVNMESTTARAIRSTMEEKSIRISTFFNGSLQIELK
jgi:hypothetical protein